MADDTSHGAEGAEDAEDAKDDSFFGATQAPANPPAATADQSAAPVTEGPPSAPSKPAVSLPSEGSHALAETLVQSILQRLILEASRKGGWLTIDDIEGLRLEFESKTAQLQAMFEKSFEQYVRLRERAAWEQARQYPFDRLIVHRFSHLFTVDGGPAFAEGGLSRRLLPGFFLALNMMLGEEITEVYQEQCRRIVAKVRDVQGDNLEWDHVYADPAARTLANDALVTVAVHFEDLPKRCAWFTGLVNGHLAPPDPAREGAEAETWQMGDRAFLLTVNALYADVRERMRTETGRLRLTKSYGAETVEVLARVLKSLDLALERGL